MSPHVHPQLPSLETSLSESPTPTAAGRTSSCSLPCRRRSSTNPLPPLPRRYSLAALPTSTAVDPRLGEKPRHTLGPWPLSRNVSTNSSTSSLRSRTCSTLPSPLVEEDDISALVAKADLDDLFNRRLDEDASCLHRPLKTRSPSEQVIIRNIFTINNSPDEEDARVFAEKVEEPKTICEFFPMFPERDSDFDKEQPPVNCKISVSGKVDASDPHNLMIRVKNSQNSYPFAHLQPGDEVHITAKRTPTTEEKSREDSTSVWPMHKDAVTSPKAQEHPWLQEFMILFRYLVCTGVILALHEGLLILLSALSGEANTCRLKNS